jgi:hypothetical protein
MYDLRFLDRHEKRFVSSFAFASVLLPGCVEENAASFPCADALCILRVHKITPRGDED